MQATSDGVQPQRPGVFGALFGGLNMMRRTLIVGMPVTLCLGLISGLGTWTVTGLVPTLSASPPSENVFDGMLLLSGVLGLYTVLQLAKSYGGQNPPGRLSWIPCLFFLPSLFLLLGLWGVSGAATSLGPQANTVALMGFLFAFDLAVWPFLGAFGVLAWLGAAERMKAEGRTGGLPRAVGESLGRFHQVAVPHGAALQAVTVGMQLLVPGIFYALQYAFVDCVAVLDPDRPALKHSGRLTWAIRGYLFRILFVWFLVAFGGAFLMTAVIDGVDNAATTLLMGPDQNFVSLRGVVVPEIFGVWCAWWSTMVMWVVYRWRLDQLSWKAARKRDQAAAEQG